MSINYTNYGTWIPPKITASSVNIVIARDSITLSIPDVPESSLLYGLNYSKNIEISKDAGVTYTKMTSNIYSFVRSVDGYPEKSDLKTNYKFKVYYTDDETAVSGEITEISLSDSDLLTYGTWLCPYVENVIATANKNYIKVQSSSMADDENGYYGTPYKKITEIKIGDNDWKEITNDVYYFDRTVDKYPEASDITANYKVRVYYTNQVTKISGSIHTADGIDVSGYGTWIPPRIETLSAIASKDYIKIESSSMSDDTNYYYGTPYQKVTQIKVKDGDWQTVIDNTYYFDREIDGYPEKADITSNYKVRVYYVDNVAGLQSSIHEEDTVDTSSYGTWLPPSVETLSATAEKDCIKIQSNNMSSDTKFYYGSPYSKIIQIQTTASGKETEEDSQWIDVVNDTYYFNRTADGYPERQEITQNYKVRAYYKNLVTNSISSEKTESVPDVSSYGTWIPPTPENVSASAERDGIVVLFPDQTNDTYYGTPYTQKYKFTLPSGESVTQTIDTYYFNRKTDGFPEKTDITNGYKVEVWYTNNVTKLSGEVLTSDKISIYTGNYGTWLAPTPTDITAVATRDNIKCDLKYEQSEITDQTYYYGAPFEEIFSISKDGGENWTEFSGSNYTFNRTTDGYPEREDLQNYKIKGHYKNAVTGVNGTDSSSTDIDVTSYGTWAVSEPALTSRVSDRTITLIMSQPASSTLLQNYGNIHYKVSVKKYEHNKQYLYAKYDEESSSFDTSKFYTDAECTIEYSEEIAVPINAVNTNKYVYNSSDKLQSEIFELQKIIYKTGSKYYTSSALTEEYTIQDDETLLELTDSTDSSISVRKFLVSTSDSIWYCPATSSDPYSSEENYKDTSAVNDYLVSDSPYVQTMPLSGQSINNMYDTVYGFRVLAYNEAHSSEYVYINATATCTSIRDIVKANADYKELYVEQLSAISANLGVITQGAFGDHNKNHIAMSTFTDENNTQWYEGETKLGGTNEYFKITIQKDSDGNPKLDDEGNIQYNIELKAGGISLTSTGTSFGNGTVFYDSSNPKRRLRISADGFVIETTTVDDPTDADWTVNSKIIIDNNNSLIISNNNEALPAYGIQVEDSITYHFKSTVTDESDTDSLDLNLNRNNISTEDYFISKNGIDGVYNGIIDKIVSAGQYLIISKSNKIEVGNMEIYSDGTTSQSYSYIADTSWGLTTTQLQSVFSKN